MSRSRSRRRDLASGYRLNRLKPLELRMTEIERLVVAGSRMCGPERLRFGPRLEGGAVFPDRMRCVQRVVFGFGTSEQVKLHKARHLVEVAVTRQPDLLEIGFGPLGHLETIHGDEHRTVSFDSAFCGLPIPPRVRRGNCGSIASPAPPDADIAK